MATLNNLCLNMMTGRSAQRLEERKSLMYLQECQELRCRELQGGQPPLGPWEGNGADNPGKKHFQAQKGEENHQEQSIGIHQ